MLLAGGGAVPGAPAPPKGPFPTSHLKKLKIELSIFTIIRIISKCVQHKGDGALKFKIFEKIMINHCTPHSKTLKM